MKKSTLPTFSNERNPQLQIIQHYNQTDQINNNQQENLQ